MERPDFFELKNGDKVKLPFSNEEYKQRINKLRNVMDRNNLDMIILTSMHNIAYYTGFIYCSFGRPYGCVITQNKTSTISANIDAVNHGVDLIAIMLFILIGREIIF